MKLYKNIKIAISVVIIALVFSCNTAKSVIASGVASDKLSAKQVIKEHQKNGANFKTLQAKVRIDIIQNEKEQGMLFNFRMEKDKAIWLSAPLGLARMLITPKKVRFYNKQDNTYFDGNYKLISNVVGVDLDFTKVQNILLGRAIFDLKDQPYKVTVNQEAYALVPKDQNALLQLFYLINASHFKMDGFQLLQNIKKRVLQIEYTDYQDVNKQILPKNINITAVEDADSVKVTLNYRSVSLDKAVRFPFKIPLGYKEISIN